MVENLKSIAINPLIKSGCR